MTPSHPSLTSPPAARAEVNYAYLHRASVTFATPAGVALRMDLYQRRSMEALSGRN